MLQFVDIIIIHLPHTHTLSLHIPNLPLHPSVLS